MQNLALDLSKLDEENLRLKIVAWKDATINPATILDHTIQAV